ncbi:uncharacterized protein LOC134249190 [Saccostrea cucullata]|uniref:uncharacterized protein LOC134249190 n=1 Tax=Saccostrea cuccullata TaxID=36930 RepID=UPI002ED4A30F
MKFQLSVSVFLIWQFVLLELLIQPANGNLDAVSNYQDAAFIVIRNEDGNIIRIIIIKFDPPKNRRRCIYCKGNLCTFTQFDSNKDGLISLEEFLQKAEGKIKLFKTAFRLVDTNADGRISQEEFQKLNIRLSSC